MSDESTPVSSLSRRGKLTTSISNLLSEAKTSPKIGVVVNLALALLGVGLALGVDNLALQFVGVAWAVLNLSGIIKWVFRL